MSQEDEEDAGGRVYFSNAGRSLEGEDEIVLISVGVDIGSSTSHIIFSRLVLERLDNRYVVSKREIIHQSEVLLTPYAADRSIDVDGLGAFIAEQYKIADIVPEEIDTGALILTGVAVRRKNARAIGELFAAQAGKFVALSAGDALEATLSAFGSGAAARSIRDAATTMNIDIGGGTTKIALCEEGRVKDITAIDVGARVVALDCEGKVARLEEAGARFAADLGLDVKLGAAPPDGAMEKIAEHMADKLLEAIGGKTLSENTASLLRLEPMTARVKPEILTFSGGVLGIYLWPRDGKLWRSRSLTCKGNPRARREMGRQDRNQHRRHSCHRSRRLAIYRAGQRQHHLCQPGRHTARAQYSGDCPRCSFGCGRARS